MCTAARLGTHGKARVVVSAADPVLASLPTKRVHVSGGVTPNKAGTCERVTAALPALIVLNSRTQQCGWWVSMYNPQMGDAAATVGGRRHRPVRLAANSPAGVSRRSARSDLIKNESLGRDGLASAESMPVGR